MGFTCWKLNYRSQGKILFFIRFLVFLIDSPCWLVRDFDACQNKRVGIDVNKSSAVVKHQFWSVNYFQKLVLFYKLINSMTIECIEWNNKGLASQSFIQCPLSVALKSSVSIHITRLLREFTALVNLFASESFHSHANIVKLCKQVLYNFYWASSNNEIIYSKLECGISVAFNFFPYFEWAIDRK